MNESILKIIEQIKKINPFKIILFGSQAWGNPDSESDVDIMVVTLDKHYPKSFQERNVLYKQVNETILDLRKEIAIDLVVYSKPMYSDFIKSQSLFAKEVELKGRVLYG